MLSLANSRKLYNLPMPKIPLIKLFSLYFPVLFWCTVIFLFSSMPTNKVGAPFNLPDFILKKSAHISEYSILAILFFRALYQTIPYKNIQKIFQFSFIFSFLYALSDEYHQSFVYGRTATLRDILIDGLGICLGLYIVKLISRSSSLNKIKPLIFG